jgi:uncharacterized protein YneF (UPF0154 family)
MSRKRTAREKLRKRPEPLGDDAVRAIMRDLGRMQQQARQPVRRVLIEAQDAPVEPVEVPDAQVT